MSGFQSSFRLTLAALLLAGCTPAGNTPLPGGPVRGSALRIGDAPREIREQRHSVLLDFEDEADEVFVDTGGGRPVFHSAAAHRGTGGVKLPAGQMRVKLSSLLSGRKFPGDWTLLGAYVRSPSPQRIELILESSGAEMLKRSVDLPADQWAPVLLDISRLAPPPEPLVLKLIAPSGEVWVDDVLLIDNSRQHARGEGEFGWTISRRGFTLTAEAPARFRVDLPTPEASPNGWTLEEANALRARFSSNGNQKSLTIFPDGRAYWDGVYKPVYTPPGWGEAIAQCHESPAELRIPEDQGRIDRQTPGDENNDGYNECRGAYQVVAAESRVQITLVPRAPVVTPAIEIKQLPPGEVLVTVEGRLIERTIRLDDGTLLIDLPLRFERPATIDVRVK